MTELTPDLAAKYARIALGHVGREYPNKLDHVMGASADVQSPRSLHPIFFGSFDWHSCVHSYWLMARLLRRFPDLEAGTEIAALFDERITEKNVAAECAYLERPSARGFERPYGWAWALALQAELDRAAGNQRLSAPVQRAAKNLLPLANAFAKRFHAFLPLATYPVRAGVHSNSAFALRLAAGYAEQRDPALFLLLQQKGRDWYASDADCQAWEPSQDDFLSSALIEAECMRRLSPNQFRVWFERFLPRAAKHEPGALFAPAQVSDRSDGKIAHLDGLNLSRAWCWRSIAAAFDRSDPIFAAARQAAETHIEASIGAVAGDYMGEHWLATYAMLALDGLE
jgi:hypothetical protein